VLPDPEASASTPDLDGPTRSSGPVLVGRAVEQARLAEALDGLPDGRGAALTLVGPAGTGKTSVLDWLAGEAAQRGFEVLRLVGVEAEVDLPWAALGGACLPRRDLFDRLPGPQGRALRSAFALADQVQPVDRLAVSLGALGVLSAVARERPLVVIVDDIHWVDPESRRALEFLARRVGDDPIALVLAGRPDAHGTSGPVVAIDGLDDEEIDRLLVDRGVRSAAAREAITGVVDGNPLLAVQLAGGLTAEERSGTRLLPATLRVPAEVEELYRPRLDELTPGTLEALAVVAADRSGSGPVLDVALRELGHCMGDLEPAEQVDLVTIDGTSVRFTHPVARSAVYQASSGPLRRRAHAALAVAEGSSPQAVLHRAAAAVGQDAELADELGQMAFDAYKRGAPVTAANLCVQAAGLAPSEHRADLLVGASRAALVAGEPRWAGELLAQARAADPERGAALDARRVEVRLAAAAGRSDEARRLAEEAAAVHGATDPVGAAEVLSEVARPLLPVEPVEAARLADRVWDLAKDADAPASWYAEILYGVTRFVLGDEDAAEKHTACWRALLDAEGPVVAGPYLAETLVLYLGKSYRPVQGLAILDEIEAVVRGTCASGALVSVLTARSYLSYGIDLRECLSAAREALELSEETGQAGLSPVAMTSAAIAAGSVGDGELIVQLTDRLLATGRRFDEVWARASLGRYHLVAGRPEEAAEQFERARMALGDGPNDTACAFEPDEADALVRCGRVDEARALLPTLEEVAVFGPWAVGQYRRICALVSDDIDEAIGHFEAAREALNQTDNRIAQGIVELNWGERLRRAKRRAEARKHLERAAELFGIVGAVGFRRRAEDELGAAGGAGDRSRPTAELLASLELQVARLAVGGSTNRDIANQLFISPRTVENHLGAVYRKLGVSGRPALLAKAASDAALRPMVHEMETAEA
jgi:DNA-binding CsgD family transcriptional regulator